MTTMTLDEVRNLPPLTKEEIDTAMNFKNTDFSDCPKMTKEELMQFKPWYELHSGWSEMENIDSLLNTMSTNELNEKNDAGKSFGEFLKGQRDKLDIDIKKNKDADEREVSGINYTMQKHGQGSFKDKRNDKAPSYAKPIDYYEAFKAEKRRQPDE